jgi:lysyl-tRNA synthetase class 1
LASVCNSDDPAALWHYISRYAPDASPESDPLLNKLVSYAIAYFKDFVLPHKIYRLPAEAERPGLEALKSGLEAVGQGASAEDLQSLVYEIGKSNEDVFPGLRDWFKALYQILLGQDQGPRMGSFMALYGVEESLGLITRALAGEDLST